MLQNLLFFILYIQFFFLPCQQDYLWWFFCFLQSFIATIPYFYNVILNKSMYFGLFFLNCVYLTSEFNKPGFFLSYLCFLGCSAGCLMLCNNVLLSLCSDRACVQRVHSLLFELDLLSSWRLWDKTSVTLRPRDCLHMNQVKKKRNKSHFFY